MNDDLRERAMLAALGAFVTDPEHWPRQDDPLFEDVARAVEAALVVVEEERSVLRTTLNRLADLHHRTVTGSRLHDPERITNWRHCPCLSCKEAAEVLESTAS